ncbi:penicillin-binding protein, 1A family [Gracilibacillus ureilyticus]|uniref:Penicillin-binding protein, 1A family n=1 Tax=Gracilibacillus ureilyticus TaxID=531814 RepID=A0A1H9SUS4_9BACI|nr:transglycosylase domain-containing protein [Gracilibacillus ureilyticus]SER88617.1 penicillin-binding protein, 1A family [Gracilibacillus ureilyticus]
MQRRRRRRRKKIGRIIKVTLFLIFLSGSFVVFLLGASFVLGPPSLEREQNTIYYSAGGNIIGEEYGKERRYWVTLDHIDDKLEKATIWTEDQKFYDHFGFDFKRLAGAIVKDIQTMSLKEGASTITQQYARNLYLSHEKTWKRKIYEAFYTIRLEMFYDKEDLLEGYLNTIYYGHGAYGIEAASKYYFNKSASELSWAEASMLAGIPKGPSIYSPFHNLEKAKERQTLILNNLYEKNVIDESTYQAALDEELNFSDERMIVKNSMAPYFLDMVEQELQDILDTDVETIKAGGYQVYTTLNEAQQLALQTSAESTITNGEIQVSAMAMDPASGAITALIGGQNYEESPFNRAVQAKRMPGSSFKPFLYYAALENGMTSATTLMSKPTTFALENGDSYQPSNFNNYYANEPITMTQAMALSDNVFAVKTNLYVTPERFVRTAKEKFGIDSELEPVASLALGTEVVSMKEMVSAYSMIANGGKTVEEYTINKVTDSQGNVLYDRAAEEKKEENNGFLFFSNKTDSDQRLRADLTYILADMMKGMFKQELNGYMSVTGASISNQLTHEYAGKSGTTNSDSWMIGFSPAVTAGVWIGYDDNREMVKTAEHEFAKNIWAGFMEKAHEDIPVTHMVRPDNIVEVPIDLNTGLLAADGCEHTYPMLFVKGTEPKKQCTSHLEDNVNQDEEIIQAEEVNTDDPFIEKWWQWLWLGEEPPSDIE